MQRKQNKIAQGGAENKDVGSDHLQAIGDASASLGLISTLVFSLSIGSLMESVDQDSHNWLALFLSLGITFSTYTMTYSLLEYYYAQTLKSADCFLSRVGDSHSYELLPAESKSATSTPSGDLSRLALMKEVEDTFASFNGMRLWARNSMWCSVMSIMAATVTKINPFYELEEKVEAGDAQKTALFFIVAIVALGSAVAIGFQSKDIKAYLCISVTGFLVSVAAAFVPGFKLRMAKLTASVFLLLGILAVPMTVKTFRAAYKPIVDRHIAIY